MKIVSSAWVPGSFAEFEAGSCLSSHAASGCATARNPFYVFVISGFEKIPQPFIAKLRDQHVIIADASSAAKEFLRQYMPLVAVLGDEVNHTYEYFCFVRWPTIGRLLEGEPFLHIDLDLFFQSSFDQISILFDGKIGTFGSPCLTSVSDRCWLEAYCDSLNRVATDREGFERSIGYEGNEFRRHISSDQDLVHAMELRGLLPIKSMFDLEANFSIFINPLRPYRFRPSGPMRFDEAGAIDRIEGKTVLFWHLQNSFADYLGRYALLCHYMSVDGRPYHARLGLPFFHLAITGENIAFRGMRDLSWQLAMTETHGDDFRIDRSGVERFFLRSWIANWFLLERKGRGLFAAEYWWEEGTFA